MSLRLRFNLVLTVVFLAGLVASGWVSYELLQANARREVAHTAELMIEAAQAIRSYTVDEVRPHLSDQLHETFLPQTVPAYAATRTLSRLPEGFRAYIYKEATLNPTNPQNRAVDWEADIVQSFKRAPDQTVLTGQRQTPEGASLFVASPIRITNEACLTCHSEPDIAPASLLQRYGSANGFGWELNDVVGIQVVSVPMSVPIDHANRAFLTFMASLCGVFVVLYIVLNVMLSRMIVRPIAEMSRAADAVSTGDFEIPEFKESTKDEVGRLALSFNRMRRSLQQAMKMIES
jgi:protein-histidine pros-kinase